MKGKVIALWGRADVGKSDTIKKTYELLKSKYKNATINKYPEPILSQVDIRIVLTINGVKIGIESQGDPGGRLPISISLFVDVGCKIIICATRTRGQTVDAVNALKQRYEIIWVEQEIKEKTSEYEASNVAMAKKLVGVAEQTINA